VATAILGISAFYHDSAAAIIIDGEIVAAAQEERFSRIKHDPSFPAHAIQYVLNEAGYDYDDLTAVVFYDKPLLKFERLLKTYHAFVPKGLLSFATSIPVWISEKLFTKRLLGSKLSQFGKGKVPLLFTEHHLSHAASAFYPSPFDEAAILTIDGVGEWATTTVSYGSAGTIKVLKELQFPHSLGLLYSAFTYYLGFKVNDGEYKVMGLAPYGDSKSEQTATYKQKITEELVDIRADGSILLNMRYFKYATGTKMTNDKLWRRLFGISRRQPNSDIHQEHVDLALAIQEVTECIIIKLVKTAHALTNSKNLVIAGGVALNCVANSKVADIGLFANIWIQPAAGDAGGALGAAFAAYHIGLNKERRSGRSVDSMKGALLGPKYSNRDISWVMHKYDVKYEYFDDFGELTSFVAQKLTESRIFGWFQGRLEYGPRALGNRSILGDARNPEMQNQINSKIKFRESFRPFAPSVMIEDVAQYFNSNAPSPYMLFVKSVRHKLNSSEMVNCQRPLNLYERLSQVRSDIPAATHVDYSARVQTVSKDDNPRFWQLINAFKKLTGTGVLINTSFNTSGEPIVCSPEDAYKAFMQTELDYLVMGNFLIDKRKQ
jgi:carbamoyltransferase